MDCDDNGVAIVLTQVYGKTQMALANLVVSLRLNTVTNIDLKK